MRYSARRQRPMLRTNLYKREQKPIKYDSMKTAKKVWIEAETCQVTHHADFYADAQTV